MIKRPILALALCLALLKPVFLFAAEDIPKDSPSEWSTLETGYLTIYYRPGADLGRIESGLSRRVTYFANEIPGENADVEERIRYQLDALFRRAEDILDMHPADIHVKIRIFRTRNEVNDEYARIFKSSAPREPGGGGLRSFYIDKYKTIYISEEDISDSIIAHEMGHAIIDSHFAVIPPEKIRELLASYIDLHLAE